MTRLEARPAIRRERLHESITEQQISDLVDRFYAAIRSNQRLGPVFRHHVDGWDVHLDKMKAFWRSVLLKSGEYKGRPVPVHQRIDGIGTEDFEEWLRLFSTVAFEVFQADAAVVANDAARRIATSLWLSRSTDPFASTPSWSRPQPLPRAGTA